MTMPHPDFSDIESGRMPFDPEHPRDDEVVDARGDEVLRLLRDGKQSRAQMRGQMGELAARVNQVESGQHRLETGLLEAMRLIVENTAETRATNAIAVRTEENTRVLVVGVANVKGFWSVSGVLTTAASRLVGFIAKLTIAGGLVAGAWTGAKGWLIPHLQSLWSLS